VSAFFRQLRYEARYDEGRRSGLRGAVGSGASSARLRLTLSSSLYSILHYLYRRYSAGKRFGHEITFFWCGSNFRFWHSVTCLSCGRLISHFRFIRHHDGDLVQKIQYVPIVRLDKRPCSEVHVEFNALPVRR